MPNQVHGIAHTAANHEVTGRRSIEAEFGSGNNPLERQYEIRAVNPLGKPGK